MSQTSTSVFHPAKTSSASRTDEAVATFAPHRSSTTVTNSRVSFESSTARILTPAKFADSEIFDARERAAFDGSVEYKESTLTAGIGNFTLNVAPSPSPLAFGLDRSSMHFNQMTCD